MCRVKLTSKSSEQSMCKKNKFSVLETQEPVDSDGDFD